MKKIILSLIALLFISSTFSRSVVQQNDTTGKSLMVIVDLVNTVINGNIAEIPIMVSTHHDSIISLNLEMQYDSAKIKYKGYANIIGNKIEMNLDTAIAKNKCNLYSFSNQAFKDNFYSQNTPLLKIKFELVKPVTESDFAITYSMMGLEERGTPEVWNEYTPFTVFTKRTVSAPSVYFNLNNTKVYPVPATNFVYIETKYDAHLVLTDISGKQLIEKSIQAFNNESLEVSGLKKGVYFVNIKGYNKCESIKIIKE